MVTTPAQEFYTRLSETRSGADDVQDFVLETESYVFPSADVLVPAPMAVSVFGQLTLVATATDFKLVKPEQGFKYVRYPDSFRATIIQLVNSGCLGLNQSFVNFNEIHKRCATVYPGVANIVQLLIGHEGNTTQQNDEAIERHLPHQISALGRTVKACLAKAQETDKIFDELLELTMEIHESCCATKGVNEESIREAELRKTILAQEQKAVEEMKETRKEALQKANEDSVNAQNNFNKALDDLPGPWTFALTGMADAFLASATGGALTLVQLLRGSRSSTSKAHVPSSTQSHSSAALDPGYEKASMLRNYSEILNALLTSGENGGPDWTAIQSHHADGCNAVRIGLEEVLRSIKINHQYAGTASSTAMKLAKTGIELTSTLKRIRSPGAEEEVARLKATVAAWQQDVTTFATEADLKLGSPQTAPSGFLPQPDYSQSTSVTGYVVRNAHYRLSVTQAQMNASRENARFACDKLMEVTGRLGEIVGQIGGLDVQTQNWQEITGILHRAIDFLCQLKKYLNNLVHFFDGVNTLVSVTMQEATDQFIEIVKNSTAIELDPHLNARSGRAGKISLDAWSRQAIYNHAISTAKISRVVENISGMYVTLYDGNVHPGVNMVLEMGRLVTSRDQDKVEAAGREIQAWAEKASESIVHIVTERMHVNEQDVQRRMQKLEKSLGGILPPSPTMESAVRSGLKSHIEDIAHEMDEAAHANPVYSRRANMSL